MKEKQQVAGLKTESVKLNKEVVGMVRERVKETKQTIGGFFEIAAGRALGPNRTEYSQDFLMWVNATGHRCLTSSQHVVAEWCFQNKEVLIQVGDIESLFLSIRSYLKSNGK